MNGQFVKILAILVVGILVGVAVSLGLKSTENTPPTCLYTMGKFSKKPADVTVTIVMGFDANYPPFTFVLPNGTPAGFDIDVMKAIAAKYGWKIVFKPWDWSTIIVALEKGDIDVIASGMSITAARSEKIWFSIPYYFYVHELVTPSNNNMGFEEILNSGKYIAVQRGSTAEEWADRLLEEGYNFKKLALDSYVAAVEAVLNGRAIAVITDSAFLDPYLKNHPDAASRLRVVTTIGAPVGYGIATRPEDKWLRDSINKALEELMNSPLWDQLLEKWDLKK